ncbi:MULTISPECIES: ankyrin repeat domain-containing protein [Streptomyces]|uniref:ankyrin repeat domain-containing protein n=1 Tax=Streptomyces TaxID=1883 RepID=UPI0015594764|nr:ankyrin repeat domain-containing protein [Streptomyces kasugaensis]
MFGGTAAGGLRVGLVLADGHRGTALDGEPWLPAWTAAGLRVRLRMVGGRGGGFHRTIDLWLSALPPEGALTLVVEWPDENVPETRTWIDTDEIRAAADGGVERWAGLQPPVPHPDYAPAFAPKLPFRGLGAVLATAGGAALRQVPERVQDARDDQDRYAPRADWDGVRWSADGDDLRLVRARLGAGAEPDTALCEAAAYGSAEVVGELAGQVRDIDGRDGRGFTALWQAVCRGRAENVSLLLAAGADPWLSQCGGRSAGGLALTVPSLAPLFERLPGASGAAAGERALQREADQLISVFDGVHAEGLSIAFVTGLDEEQVIRRLGADPAGHPVLDLDRAPGPYGTGPGGFDPNDCDEAQNYAGVTGVPGGCVLMQPLGHRLSSASLMASLSPSTAACGVSFHLGGGTFGASARNGAIEWSGELPLSPTPDVADAWWLFRLWDRAHPSSYGAREIAYACWTAGMRLTDSSPVGGPPRRWVRVGAAEG